ncbi:hypothetical protein J6590_093469 [Homalodisca vitripennis]|nr:hypothetical protein J6590_093469 [Homalodisca vitripennis]
MSPLQQCSDAISKNITELSDATEEWAIHYSSFKLIFLSELPEYPRTVDILGQDEDGKDIDDLTMRSHDAPIVGHSIVQDPDMVIGERRYVLW